LGGEEAGMRHCVAGAAHQHIGENIVKKCTLHENPDSGCPAYFFDPSWPDFCMMVTSGLCHCALVIFLKPQHRRMAS